MGEIKEIIKVEDKSRIESVTFLMPDLMGSKAVEIVKDRYNRLYNLQQSLYKARYKTRELEEEVKKAQAEWNKIATMITYTHPIKEKVYHKEVCNFAIKGHGNDIIGKTTVM